MQKKHEHKEMKLGHDIERKQMKKEQIQANKMKFTGMKKTKYFLPTVTNGTQFTSINSIDVGTHYIDHRDK